MNFQADVLDRSRDRPIVVDFWAPWCGPCKVLGPLLERLDEEAGDEWQLVKVNTDEHPDLARTYRIQGIPSVKLFRDGEVAAEFTGALPEPQLRAWVAEHIPSPLRQTLAAAAAAHRRGDRAAALAGVEQVLGNDPEHVDGRILWAQLHFAQDPEAAMARLDGIPDTDPAYEHVDAMRTLFVLAGRREELSKNDGKAWDAYVRGIDAFTKADYDAALSGWIEAVRINKSIDDGGPRRACVALFHWLGEEHELTEKHRPDLASAMY